MKTGFCPIKFDDYVDGYLKINPDTSRDEITNGLKDALNAYKKGIRCRCSKPIWVIGSAVMGYSCFMCITGEAKPDSDYEIDEACG
jgi:hypothetical protein